MPLSNFCIFSLLIAYLLALASAACYHPDGTIETDIRFQPCVSTVGTPSMCCATTFSNDQCLPSGLCWNPCTPQSCDGPGIYWRELCSDPTWQSPNCLRNVCTSPSDPQGTSRGTSPVSQCPIDKKWCCGGNLNASTCCAADVKRVEIAATIGVSIPSMISSALRSSTISSTLRSSTISSTLRSSMISNTLRSSMTSSTLRSSMISTLRSSMISTSTSSPSAPIQPPGTIPGPAEPTKPASSNKKDIVLGVGVGVGVIFFLGSAVVFSITLHKQRINRQQKFGKRKASVNHRKLQNFNNSSVFWGKPELDAGRQDFKNSGVFLGKPELDTGLQEIFEIPTSKPRVPELP